MVLEIQENDATKPKQCAHSFGLDSRHMLRPWSLLVLVLAVVVPTFVEVFAEVGLQCLKFKRTGEQQVCSITAATLVDGHTG